jgi:hypothetical protein
MTVSSPESAKYSPSNVQTQNHAAKERKTVPDNRLKMTGKEIRDLRSAMEAFQGELDAERRKARIFRDQIMKFKNDVQEKGFEAQLEKLVAEAQKGVARAGDECRRYECSCAGHRFRSDWKGCGCGCAKSLSGDLEQRLGSWILEGMPKGLMLDCREAGGNGGTIIHPSV